MPEQQASFEGWARVEVMGHQTHIGFVRTEAYGQAVMFRVDQPEFPAREFTLTKPAYVDGCWTGVGAKVQRPAIEGCSVLIGAGSIYRMIPCSEQAARIAIEETQRAELKLIELPPVTALPEAPRAFELEDEDGPGPSQEYDEDQEDARAARIAIEETQRAELKLIELPPVTALPEAPRAFELEDEDGPGPSQEYDEDQEDATA